MILDVPLSLIDDNLYQRRTEYGDVDSFGDKIAAARSSFSDTRGLIQVPRVRIVTEDGDPCTLYHLDQWFAANSYPAHPAILLAAFCDMVGIRFQLLAGHRRKRAFDSLHRRQVAGYEDGYMPVHLSEATDQDMLDAAWRENKERQDTSAVEDARLAQAAIEQLKISQADLAKRWGLARSTITNLLRLLELSAEVQEANITGRLSARVCQELCRVAEVAGAVVEGEGNWGTSGYDYRPVAPAVFFHQVVERGDVSSEEIRAYIKKAEDTNGAKLPPIIAQGEILGGDKIVQAGCRGCPHRRNDTCFRPVCLNQKKAIYGEAVARNAAAELNIPFSDNPDHFKRWADFDKLKELRKLWSAESCTHLVIGWWPAGSAVRPFPYGRTDYLSGNDAYQAEAPRLGVAIGCTHAPHSIPAVCWPQTPENKLEAKISSWRTVAQSQTRHIKKATVTALADNLAQSQSPAALGVLAKLLKLEGDEAGAARRLVDFAWSRATDHISSHEAFKFHQTAAEALATAGLDPAILEDTDQGQALSQAAHRLLAHWYGRSSRTYASDWYAEEYARQVQPALGPLLERMEEWSESNLAGNELMVELQKELDLVQEEVAAVLKGKGGQANVLCANCSDPAEDAEEYVQCSCGQLVCDACYLQYDHYRHDTSAEEFNVALREQIAAEAGETVYLVSQAILDDIAQTNSCDLIMAGRIKAPFYWNDGRHYICTGAMGTGAGGWEECECHPVVERASYTGPTHTYAEAVAASDVALLDDIDSGRVGDDDYDGDGCFSYNGVVVKAGQTEYVLVEPAVTFRREPPRLAEAPIMEAAAA